MRNWNEESWINQTKHLAKTHLKFVYTMRHMWVVSSFFSSSGIGGSFPALYGRGLTNTRCVELEVDLPEEDYKCNL
jgi:hypothetical protein